MKFIVILALALVLLGCGDSDTTHTPTSIPEPPAPTVTSTPTPPFNAPGESVTISGRVTYDFVPSSNDGSLNYDGTELRAVRGATVQLFDASNRWVATDTTDNNGDYSIQSPANQLVQVRVLAELLRGGSPSWDFKITDNTQGNAVYALAGQPIDSGDEDSTRDLHAPSGWDGSNYSSPRVAAPFSILDALYEAKQLVLEADATVNFPEAEFRWSIDNTPVVGARSAGNIGTSFYDPQENNMYILGDANDDTDEYDWSVIQHEWAHYLEDTLSRSDSIGGNHALDGVFDMRLAFGEGFANAFSAIAGGRSDYSDSSGSGQSRGFVFSLEQNNSGNLGWFSENSVGKIVYDIADNNNEGADTLTLGFAPIFQTLTSDGYVEGVAMTSIYAFINQFEVTTNYAYSAGLNQLMMGESIFGDGDFGLGETNDSATNISFVLPVYNNLSLDETINLCGNNRQGEYNGLDVRRFARLNIPQTGRYQLVADKTLGTGDRNPDMMLWRRGVVVARLNNRALDRESGQRSLQAGDYILELYDYLNTDDIIGGGTSCFEVSVTTL